MFVSILMSLSVRVPKSLTDVAPPVRLSQSRLWYNQLTLNSIVWLINQQPTSHSDQLWKKPVPVSTTGPLQVYGKDGMWAARLVVHCRCPGRSALRTFNEILHDLSGRVHTDLSQTYQLQQPSNTLLLLLYMYKRMIVQKMHISPEDPHDTSST